MSDNAVFELVDPCADEERKAANNASDESMTVIWLPALDWMR